MTLHPVIHENVHVNDDKPRRRFISPLHSTPLAAPPVPSVAFLLYLCLTLSGVDVHNVSQQAYVRLSTRPEDSCPPKP